MHNIRSIVVIGSSLGGVEALSTPVGQFPADVADRTGYATGHAERLRRFARRLGA